MADVRPADTSRRVASARVYLLIPNTAIPAADLADPITSGNFDSSGFTYQLPLPGQNATVVARAFYQWPLFVTGLGYNIANIGRNTANTKRLLAATAAFHVEP